MTPPDRYHMQLSSYDAAQCEAAVMPRCHCRCGGALHGRAHFAFRVAIRKVLEGEEMSITREDAIALAGEIAKKEPLLKRKGSRK
ncbi:hypothetical protein LCGC14_0846840 [marine sediment metagenome]|uniref:Uncharacterized protein n=1 Tax=marine sediment metagenome TaxID=412755 RepID=A0A0F9SIJ8_9ZZZZ